MNNIYIKTTEHGTHEVISINLIDDPYKYILKIYIDPELIYEFAGEGVQVSQYDEFGGFVAELIKVDNEFYIKQINHVDYLNQNIEGFTTEPFEGSIFKV